MLDQWKPFFNWLKRYFAAYGGWHAIFYSPLLHLSLVVTVLNYPNWSSGKWADLALSLIPSLLGFSLGTYAILFSLMSDRLKLAMAAAKDNNSNSRLLEVNTTFFHFIFVQVVTILWALCFYGNSFTEWARILSNLWSPSIGIYRTFFAVSSALGFLLMTYSTALILAAAMAVYRLALIGHTKQNDATR